MRRFTLAALMWMALGGVAWAQNFIGPPQRLTQQDTGACASATMCATYTLPANITTLTFGLTGISSDTLSFQGTADGSTWVTILVSSLSTGTQVTATQTNGNYSVPNAGFVSVRVVLTTRVSGTPTVTLTRGFGLSRLAPVVPAFPATFAIGDLVYANTTTTVAGLADVATGRVLASGGVGVAPAYTATPTFTSARLNGNITIGATAADFLDVSDGTNSVQGNFYYTTNAGFTTYERLVIGYPSTHRMDLRVEGNTGSLADIRITPGSSQVDHFASNLVAGADNNANTRTNTTTKVLNYSVAGYTNGSNVQLVAVAAQAASNNLDFGGSSSANYAATQIGFWTAANNTTATGTERLRVDSSGNVSVRTAGANLLSPILNASSSQQINGALTVSATAPTVAAGFGSTSPGTVTHNTGTFVVMVTVGTNAGGTTGSLTLPTAPTGWACELHDVTNTADLTRQTGYTTTTAAFSTTVAWTTGDVLVGHCGPF